MQTFAFFTSFNFAVNFDIINKAIELQVQKQSNLQTTVASPIVRRRSNKFKSLQGGVIFEFCPLFSLRSAVLSKKVAFVKEWRSIGVVTVFNYFQNYVVEFVMKITHITHYFTNNLFLRKKERSILNLLSKSLKSSIS